MLVWQGIVAVAGDGRSCRGRYRGVRVEGVEGLHAADGAWDHGNGVGRHQWHVLRCSPQGQRVVGRADRRSQGLQVAVDSAGGQRRAVLQLHPLLLHLQRHQLLLLAQSQVVVRRRAHHSHANAHAQRGAPLRRESAVASLHEFVSLVPFVIKRSERQNVKEKKRGAHGYRHAQLRGIVPSLHGEGRVAGSLGAVGVWIWGVGGGYGVPCGAGVGPLMVFVVFGASGWQSRGDRTNDFLMEAVKMWHQLQPEGHLVGPVVVSDTRLQANMQIMLVFGAELCPNDLFKAIWLGVDEGCVLRNRQVRIPVKK